MVQNNKSKETSLRKVQLLQLDILNAVVGICDKHDLTYYLIGGTLIGAIRHKGFIPWDDDIDIAMPRKDYDEFIKMAKKELKEPYKIRHYSTDKDYRFYLLNVVNTKARAIIDRAEPIKMNIWIDILPIDVVPEKAIRNKIFKAKILKNRALIGLTNIDIVRNKKRSFIEKTIIVIGKFTKIGKLIKRQKVMHKNDKYLRKLDYEKATLVGTFYGNYGFHEIVPKEYFGNGAKVTFEGRKYNAPEQYDKYLTHMYGDYMKLPPEEKRKGHHILKIIEEK